MGFVGFGDVGWLDNGIFWNVWDMDGRIMERFGKPGPWISHISQSSHFPSSDYFNKAERLVYAAVG